jgi:sugar phosphate isomerase/epimerase
MGGVSQLVPEDLLDQKQVATKGQGDSMNSNTARDARNSSLSRRDLLKVAGIGAIPMLAHGGTVQSMVPAGRLKNTQLSLAAYSMRKALTDGSMDLFQFIDWCAELDLAGTELTSYYFKPGFDRSYLHQLKRHAYRSGVTISGTAVRNNFCLPPGPKKQKEIDHVRQWIDHAAELSAPHIRIFAGDVPAGVAKEAAIQWVADGIKEALEHAGARGVFLGLENHGGITARVADHLAICDRVGDHPWFGINLDTGNYQTDAYVELAMAAPRAVNVQVKHEIRRNDGTSEITDLQKMKEILSQARYRGWIVLEYEGESPVTAVPEWIARLKQTFS